MTTGAEPRVTPIHVGSFAARQIPRYSVYLSVLMERRKPKGLVRSVTY
jgi:hypothetical protein